MDEEMIPDGIILFDPHPNPFTDRVFIQYALPKEVRDAGAQIEIYNAMGARILLMNARQQPGPGKWTWESEGQTFGMYFVRLTCGDQTVTKKFLKR